MNDCTEDDRAALADELLVIRCQLGERDAFDALVQRWQRPLWRYARNLAGQESAADDAVQDIWVRVLRGIAGLRDAARLRPWLFGIAHRVMMDRLREQYGHPHSTDIDLDALPEDEAEPNLELEVAAVLESLSHLPLVENEVLTLFYLRELSLNEVAQVLGIPTGTVKSRLHRARSMLRRQMQSKGIEP